MLCSELCVLVNVFLWSSTVLILIWLTSSWKCLCGGTAGHMLGRHSVLSLEFVARFGRVAFLGLLPHHFADSAEWECHGAVSGNVRP